MSNRETQSKAIDKIHTLASDANMMVFILCDEDLEMIDDDCDLTQDEKDDIWERMHERLLDFYHENLEQIVEDIKSER